MTDPFQVGEIIAKLQLLRLNVMPPYTYDDDEGQRSDDEYISYYQKAIDESIVALNSYIKSLADLLDARSSEGAFSNYLAARKHFVETFPFCEDEFPSRDTIEYQSIYEALRLASMSISGGVFSNRDWESLREYRERLLLLRDQLLG